MFNCISLDGVAYSGAVAYREYKDARKRGKEQSALYYKGEVDAYSNLIEEMSGCEPNFHCNDDGTVVRVNVDATSYIYRF